MRKTVCDKCEKEIVHDPYRVEGVIAIQAKFPYISTSKMDNFFDFKQYDLCDTCTDKLISWLDNKDATNEKEFGWIRKGKGDGEWFECSNCGARNPKDHYCVDKLTAYCPECGKKMEKILFEPEA